MFFSLNSTRVRIVILIIFIIIIWFTTQHFKNNNEPILKKDRMITIDDTSKATFPKIQVAVFYEALCPDSRNFFLKQLQPAYDKIPHLMDIVLEPYGKAQTEYIDGHYIFDCQHGSTECEANKIHACSIKYIDDRSLLLKYTSCMINNNLYPEDIARSCSQQYSSNDINIDEILRCSRSAEGSELLKFHGDHTHALASVSFIPTILLDGSIERQPAILKDLFKEICKKYQNQMQVPIECT